jgi:hypothetical protein
MHSNEKSYLKKLIIFQLFFFPLRCPGRCKNASQFFRVKDNSNLYCLGFHQDRWPESPGPTSPTNQTVQDFPRICSPQIPCKRHSDLNSCLSRMILLTPWIFGSKKLKPYEVSDILVTILKIFFIDI